MNKELMGKFKGKKKVHDMWKKGLPTWKEYWNVVRAHRYARRQAKDDLELNIAKEVRRMKRKAF